LIPSGFGVSDSETARGSLGPRILADFISEKNHLYNIRVDWK